MAFESGTKMKNLGEQAGFRIMELGDLMYLLLPKEPTDRVIISAHGGHAVLSNTNRFKVPSDTVLRFYSDDTFSVLDPGFDNFYKKEAAPKEIVYEGDMCFDYLLSKYQGRHGNKEETYESIAKAINDAVGGKAFFKGQAAKASTPKAKQSYLEQSAASKVAAVVTIRNRWFKGDATLSMVVNAVKKAAPSIVIFDCLFCRSTLFGGSQDVKLVRR